MSEPTSPQICILCGTETSEGAYHTGRRVNLTVYELFTCTACCTPDMDSLPTVEQIADASTGKLLEYLEGVAHHIDSVGDRCVAKAIELWPHLPRGNRIDKYYAWEMQQRSRIGRAHLN